GSDVGGGEVRHDFVCWRHAEYKGDRHRVHAHVAVFAHDDVRMRRHETDQPAAGPDRVSAGVTGIVKAGLGVTDDVHRGDVRRCVLVLVEGDGQLGPIGLVV